MIVKEKLGRLSDFAVNGREVDVLAVEWFETAKRILHKRTQAGREIVLKFMKENPDLSRDDVLFEDEHCVIVVEILSCEVIVVRVGSLHEMARLCYEIGNKHLPLFYENEEMLIPYDEPLFRWLVSSGFQPVKEQRKLLNQLRTSVAAHAHGGNSSLLSRILNLTASNE
ncbi:MAG: urease accessory protein UreE [Chitinophagaceae bacterium]